MSCSSGPDIVNDGLVLNLDAANFRSYPGSGTTWNDLSGNGNNGTLVNGVGYNANNKGSLTFDGVNDYATLPTNILIHQDGNPFTISIWFRTANNTGIILGQQLTSTVGVSGGYVPSIYVDTNGKLRTSCFWGGSVSNQSVSSISVNDNIFHQITVTVSGTTHKSYLDGNWYADLTKTQTSYSSIYYYFLGAGTQNGWSSIGSSIYFNGSITNIQMYNRALSAQEIQQNFNATRSRYGI